MADDAEGIRPRFGGSAEELANIVKPYASVVGWLQYGEKTASPVQQTVLVAHAQMFSELFEASGTRAFTKLVCTQMFEIILDQNKYPELPTQELKDMWVEANTKRFKLMCRHLAQAKLRKPPPEMVETFREGWRVPWP